MYFHCCNQVGGSGSRSSSSRSSSSSSSGSSSDLGTRVTLMSNEQETSITWKSSYLNYGEREYVGWDKIDENRSIRDLSMQFSKVEQTDAFIKFISDEFNYPSEEVKIIGEKSLGGYLVCKDISFLGLAEKIMATKKSESKITIEDLSKKLVETVKAERKAMEDGKFTWKLVGYGGGISALILAFVTLLLYSVYDSKSANIWALYVSIVTGILTLGLIVMAIVGFVLEGTTGEVSCGNIKVEKKSPPKMEEVANVSNEP